MQECSCWEGGEHWCTAACGSRSTALRSTRCCHPGSICVVYHCVPNVTPPCTLHSGFVWPGAMLTLHIGPALTLATMFLVCVHACTHASLKSRGRGDLAGLLRRFATPYQPWLSHPPCGPSQVDLSFRGSARAASPRFHPPGPTPCSWPRVPVPPDLAPRRASRTVSRLRLVLVRHPMQPMSARAE